MLHKIIPTCARHPFCFGAIVASLFCGSTLFGQAVPAPAAEPATDDKVIVLDPWSVTGTTAVGYGSTQSVGGSRINLPILDVPMSIIPVNRELMDDVGAADAYDALRFVSGMGPASTVSINSMTLRGIETRANSFNVLDGLPGGGIEQETEFIDRYEVVKGAAGTLYGDHSLGGLINRVYKRPLTRPQTTIKGSYRDIGNTWQSSLDHTGPIDRDGQLAYRVVGVVRDGETKTGGADSKTALYGTVQYAPKDTRTNVWLRFERRTVDTGHETPGVFYDGAGNSSLPYLGVERRTVPINNDEERTFAYYEFGYSSSFSGLLGDWDVRLVGRYFQDKNVAQPAIIPTGYTFLDANGNSLGSIATAANPATQPSFTNVPWTDIRLTNHVSRVNGPSDSKSWGWFLDFTGSFDTGPLAHRMIVYAQSTGSRSHSQFTNLRLKSEFGGSASTGNLNLANAFSVINPVYRRADLSLFENPVLATNNKGGGERFNFGIQDNVYLWDQRLLLVAGARYDFVRNNASRNLITNVSGNSQSTTNWVYKAAAVVKPFENRGVAFFLNYAETFEPRFGELVAGSGIPFKNLEGTSEEAGVKFELLEARLIATASYFNNELANNPIRIFNPATGLDEFRQEGITPIKGWEVDLSYLINDNWTILVGLSDVDSRNPSGLRLRNVQNEFNYKFLLKYTGSKGGALEGFTVGASAVSIGDRFGDNPNTFVTRGYTTVDAFLGYSVRNWRFQFNVYNALDEEGVVSSIFQALALANDPRNFRFSVQYDF